jgi:hypothetical protein
MGNKCPLNPMGYLRAGAPSKAFDWPGRIVPMARVIRVYPINPTRCEGHNRAFLSLEEGIFPGRGGAALWRISCPWANLGRTGDGGQPRGSPSGAMMDAGLMKQLCESPVVPPLPPRSFSVSPPNRCVHL